jgi:hypothetical protein
VTLTHDHPPAPDNARGEKINQTNGIDGPGMLSEGVNTPPKVTQGPESPFERALARLELAVETPTWVICGENLSRPLAFAAIRSPLPSQSRVGTFPAPPSSVGEASTVVEHVDMEASLRSSSLGTLDATSDVLSEMMDRACSHSGKRDFALPISSPFP